MPCKNHLMYKTHFFSWRTVALGASSLAGAFPSPTPASRAVACADISIPTELVPGAEISVFSAAERHNVSGTVFRPENPENNFISGLHLCQVNVTLAHPDTGGTDVSFEIWLPLGDWNGRFLGVGGGAWLAGWPGTRGLGIAVQQGYVAAVTDGGGLADENAILIPERVLKNDGKVDLARFNEFAARSLHELAVIGKAVTKAYFGTPPRHSYWHGCSQGGRQGYMLAQRYPHDFDGIVAAAPAVYLPSLLTALNWGDVVARSSEIGRPSACVLEAFRAASVEACDGLDGVLDGIIADPDRCDFDPTILVNAKVTCDGGTVETITDEDKQVVAAIHEAPTSPTGTKLWEAFPWGIAYNTIFSPIDPDGDPRNTVISRLYQDWVRYFVAKDAEYNVTSSLDDAAKLTDAFAVSQAEYGGIIGTDQVDLSGFRDAGGKLLTWHGTADEIIMLNNTLRYRRAVEAVMGGGDAVDEFYRVFLVPGLAHCSGGSGGFPTEDLDILIRWVENDKAPDEMGAFSPDGKMTGKLCLWPKVARYDGIGDPDDSDSYECAPSFGMPV